MSPKPSDISQEKPEKLTLRLSHRSCKNATNDSFQDWGLSGKGERAGSHSIVEGVGDRMLRMMMSFGQQSTIIIQNLLSVKTALGIRAPCWNKQ